MEAAASRRRPRRGATGAPTCGSVRKGKTYFHIFPYVPYDGISHSSDILSLAAIDWRGDDFVARRERGEGRRACSLRDAPKSK